LGTPDYMAPEQVKGKRGDARTDLYSLGIILYEMITGALPFDGTNPYAIMHARLAGDPIAPHKWYPEISPHVEEVILHAMERQPFDRYPNAAAMKAELDSPASVELTGRRDRLRPQRPWNNRWHSYRWLVFAILLPIVTFGLMYFVTHNPWKGH
jgi:serine/threonine protein kinase